MTSTRARQHGRAIIFLSVAAFASSTSARLCDPMLPELARAFVASPTEVAHVVSGFSVAYGLLQLFYGPLGDRVGKYRLVALTTLLSTLGTLAAAFASSLDWLIVARILSGISAAGIIPLSMAWIGDAIPYEERQATLARFLFGQILGVIGGQFIGGVFADTLGWRWAFGFLGVIYLIAGLLVFHESRHNSSTFHQAHSSERKTGIVSQALTVWSAPWARVVLTIVSLEGMTVYGTLAFVPSFIHEHFGLTLSMAGALMGLFGLGGLTYISFARFFVHRLGEVGLAFSGSILIAVAWLILAVATSWIWTMPASYLAGLGFYMLHNTLQINATQMAPQVRGTSVSLFASAFFFGQSIGVMVAATILAKIGAFPLFISAALLIAVFGTWFSMQLKVHHSTQKK